VTITQSVAIDAAPGITAFIHPPSGDAITINAGVSDAVSLRGVTLNGGSSFGISVNAPKVARLRECNVQDADVTVRDSVVAGNGGAGFFATASLAASGILNVYQCISTNNGGDEFLASNSGTGFVIARVANSSISENIGIGLDNFNFVTFESLGNNLVRGNLGGSVSGAVTVVAPE